MSTASQLDQIKWMLLADMPGRADVERWYANGFGNKAGE